MKKVFVSLLLLMTALASWALEVVFVPMGTADTARPLYIEKDGVRLEITKGIDNGSHFRVYKNEQMIITSQVGPITQIVIECIALGTDMYGPGNFISEPPGYSSEDNIGLWRGSSYQVIFTAVGGQVRVTKITVTIDDGLSKPVISPASGTYYEPIEVSMLCYTQDATIHYTIDGSTPTTSSPQYTAPFALSTDATIKAISTLDGEVSDVVTATYEFIEPIPGNPGDCFSDFADLPDGTVLTYPSPVYAIFQHNNYLFVKDQCGGYALIYGNTGQTYKQGDVIPEGFVVTKATYSGEPEYKNPANFKPATANVPIEPEEITANQVGHDLFGHYVVLHNVTIVKEGNVYYVIDENGNVVAVYFGSLGVPAPSDLEHHYDLYAIVGSYGSNTTVYQLLPVRLVPLPIIPIVTLCDMDVIPDGETLTFDQEAIAIYQSGRYLYLKQGDFCYGLVYGDIGQTYNRGDIIPPGWGGTKTTYNGEPELKNPTGFSPSTSHVDVVPEVIRIPDIGHMTWAHYVRINGVHIDQERQVIIDSEGISCPYYPKLPFQIDQTKIYNVTGIITSYGRTEVIYQFCFTDLGDLMPPPPIVCSISEAKQYNPEIIVQFECPLTVIYQNGMYLYVKDSCGEYGLIYGNAGGPFVNGDLIIGKAKGGTYSDNFQLNAVDDWVKIGHGDPVEPIETDYVEEIYQDMCHQYIRLEDVKIVFDENGNAHIEDETGIILLFDKFNIQVTHGGIIFTLNPCDVNWDGEVNIADINALIEYIISTPDECGPMRLAIDDIDPNITYDVEGFLSIYKSELELFPTMICPHYSIPYPKCRWDVNGDGEVTIADINCVIDAILQH
jgi:hypothetical protein